MCNLNWKLLQDFVKNERNLITIKNNLSNGLFFNNRFLTKIVLLEVKYLKVNGILILIFNQIFPQ